MNALFFPTWAQPLVEKYLTQTKHTVSIEPRENDLLKMSFLSKDSEGLSMDLLGKLLSLQINAVRVSSSSPLCLEPNEEVTEKHLKESGSFAHPLVLGRIKWKREKDYWITQEPSHLLKLGQQLEPTGWDTDLAFELTRTPQRIDAPSLRWLNKKYPKWGEWRDGFNSSLYQWVMAHCNTNFESVTWVDWLKSYEAHGGDICAKNDGGRHVGLSLTMWHRGNWDELSAALDWLESRGLDWWTPSQTDERVEVAAFRNLNLFALNWDPLLGSEEISTKNLSETARRWFAERERERLNKKMGDSANVKTTPAL
jgi:hypothetical protein